MTTDGSSQQHTHCPDSYLSLINGIPYPTWRAGQNGQRDYFNQAWLDFTGREIGEEVGDGWTESVHPEDLARLVQTYSLAFTQREPFELEYRLRHASGEYRWVLEAGRPFRDPSGNFAGYVGCCYDMSEQKQVEKELRSNQVLFQAMFQYAPDGVILVDTRGRILLSNRQVELMFGYTSEELQGQPVEMLMPESFRKLHERQVAAYAKAPRVRPMGENLDLQGRKKDGTVFPLDITLGPLKIDERQLVLATIRDISERKKAEEELFLYKNHLEELVEARTAELQHEIAERRRAEEQIRRDEQALESYAGQLARSNRDLQDFATIVSHDLHEPLRKILAFGDRLQTRHAASLGEEGNNYLERILDAATRMQAMLDALLSYSRVSTRAQPPEQVDLNQIAHDVVEDLVVRIEETRGKVEVGELPTIEAEPLQMRQLFQNLIGNALKFHRPGVSPLVQVSATFSSDPGLAQVHLYFTDNGIGFEEQYLERIFQPFQRLHGRSKYEGAGMGLAICRKIVERHGGRITASSTPGEGTTFEVILPAQQ